MAIIDDTGHRIGLVMRGRFQQAMSGPYGYGRALWSRRPISDLTDWHPLLVPAALPVLEASDRMRQRPDSHRYDDLLVDIGAERLGRVSTAIMLDALAHRLAGQAIRDGLTGVANRTRFLERLTAACARAEHATQLLVAFIDLDGMKPVNDTYGHQTGDQLLVSVARALTAVAGEGGVVARLGGDEFAVLVPVPSDVGADVTAAAARFGQRLRQAISRHDPVIPATVRARASIGVAIGRPPTEPQPLLASADLAMYQAKQSGGDTFVIARARTAPTHPAYGNTHHLPRRATRRGDPYGPQQPGGHRAARRA